MAPGWTERVSAFCSSPSRFLCGTSSEVFLAELLRELRDDRANYSVKVLLVSPLCEYPALLCPSDSVVEETALELMSIFAQSPPRFVHFRSQLLVALTCVLTCSVEASSHLRAFPDFLDLLLQLAQDTSDLHGDAAQRSLRATACDCLREMEVLYPGLLSQRLELLGALRHLETSRLHQAYAGLQTLVLRNVVYLLTGEKEAGAAHLKALLGGNESVGWEADQNLGAASGRNSPPMSSVILTPMGTVPTLLTGADCKELRSVLSSLLEESYLFTPLSQAELLYRLTEVVAMVPAIPPTIFRAQLLRLLGTSEASLLHTTLLMKSAFTDSLFSSEDEAFLLKRLVVLSQHPLLSTPEKLFYMDCILHFPENRPISFGDGDEALPVLLTPRLASALLPVVFNDSATLLARFNLLSLVYLEAGEEEDGRGLEYLYEHLTSLLRVVESGGKRESVVTFFRAAFLFLFHFHHVERYSDNLSQQLCQLYLQHTRFAPHLINLADQTQEKLPNSTWAFGLLKALQRVISQTPVSQVTLRDLSWHLKVVARAAEEGEIPQNATLRFLSGVITSSSLGSSTDWRLGNGILGVCRRLLLHPSLDSILIPLADGLQYLANHYSDTDIRDHARLYYTLLTTLSQEKLASVLAHHAEGGQQVKKRTLSCLMTEGEGLTSILTIHETEAAIFRLIETQCEQPEAKEVIEDETQRGEADLETYRTRFDNTAFSPQVTLKFLLTHTESRDARFDQLFSIRLHFSLTDDHYSELQDVSVPCLFRDRPPPVVALTLKPKQPYPTSLRVSAIFTTQDGLTWHTTLPDIHVCFQQVFLPLPAPPSWGRTGRQAIFTGLWEEILGETGECAVSLFCCRLEDEALNALMEKHFLPFLVSDPAHKEQFRVLLFLPPQSHVLLQVSSEEDAVHFNIATDSWRLLPHMNEYLLQITAS